MRLATWNVNSIRSRIDRVERFLERQDVDVLALQETKARDDQWPTMGLEAMGYEVASYGLNQWNGVAIVSRVGLADVSRGFEGMPGYGEPLAVEARAIGATCGGVRMWRSEEHTSELQSQFHLVCRLLLEKKKNK